MLLHPCVNIPHFEQRIAAIFSWAESGENASAAAAPAYGSRPMSKQELARDIFFSNAKPGSAPSRAANGAVHAHAASSSAPKPTLSFFAAAAAAFALGSLVARDEDPEPEHGDPSPPAAASPGDSAGTPAMLFSLSEQSLQLFEKTSAYDLDSVIAMILQVLYMLHEGQMSVAQGVFPLVSGFFNLLLCAGAGIGVC